jgi:hypothetical protein
LPLPEPVPEPLPEPPLPLPPEPVGLPVEPLEVFVDLPVLPHPARNAKHRAIVHAARLYVPTRESRDIGNLGPPKAANSNPAARSAEKPNE